MTGSSWSYSRRLLERGVNLHAGGKRPRLEPEHSTASSASTSSFLDTSGPYAGPSGFGRGPVPSTGSAGAYSNVSGHSSPRDNVGIAPQPMNVGGAQMLRGASSNSSASPTSTLGYRESTFSPSALVAAPRATSTEEGRERSLHQSPKGGSLPITPSAEGSEDRNFQGGIPGTVTEVAHERGRISPQINSRRSNRAPAPLLRYDTSKSSTSSNLSFASTTSSGMYTPITPVDEPRAQRAVHGPSSVITKPSEFHPLPQPVHPPLSSYTPSVYTGLPPLQIKDRIHSSSSSSSPSGMNLFYLLFPLRTFIHRNMA